MSSRDIPLDTVKRGCRCIDQNTDTHYMSIMGPKLSFTLDDMATIDTHYQMGQIKEGVWVLLGDLKEIEHACEEKEKESDDMAYGYTGYKEIVKKYDKNIFDDILPCLTPINKKRWNDLDMERKRMLCCLWIKTRTKMYMNKMSLVENLKDPRTAFTLPPPINTRDWINDRVLFVYRNTHAV